jgi:hypothetical protein
MNRNGTHKKSPVENELLAQLVEIEHTIDNLIAEKEALRRLITRVRHANLATREVTRKNSFDRILTETQIIEALRQSGGPLSVKRLLQEARSIKFDLKDNTFRSYLHRLKVAGVIVPAGGQQGYWKLAEPAIEQSSKPE